MRKIVVWLKKWYVIVPLFLIMGAAVYWWYQSRDMDIKTPYIVKSDALRQTLTFSGTMEAEETATLRFQSGGRLAWVGVKEGDLVKKYQAIASLDQRQLQKTLEKYLNTYEIQRNSFDQTREDNDQLTIALSQEVRDRASRVINNGQSSLDNTVLDVELQSIAKEYAHLVSPIDGVVTYVGAKHAGTNVTVSDTFEIVNPKTLYFVLSADQTEVVRMAEKMEGNITLDAFPDESIRGYVRSIAYTPKTDETGTVYEIKMDIEPSQELYRVGMTGDAEFILKQRKNALSIPLEYILEEKGKSYVYRMSDKTPKKTLVVAGEEYDEGREIKEGLQEGDQIVIPPK